MEIEIIERRRLPDGSLSITRKFIAPAMYYVEHSATFGALPYAEVWA